MLEDEHYVLRDLCPETYNVELAGAILGCKSV